MRSPNSPELDSWTRCRDSFERGLVHAPLFATPLRVIDWAVAHGLTESLHAWLSHDLLVISNRRWDAKRADKIVIVPKPDSVELRLYRDGTLVRGAAINEASLEEELDSLVSQFRHTSEP